MVKTFAGLDNEFAIATGSNVNSGPGSSTFDYPPNSTTGLTVTSNSNDPDANLFETGETYDVAWSGSSGSGYLQDAVVLRSDAAPVEGGVIVFEGYDTSGNLVHLVWSPGFDLESWYWNNYDNGSVSGFYTTDQDTAYTHSVVCFAAESRILTRSGWRQAGSVGAGDRVWTLDAGYQRILWAGARTVAGNGRNAPVCFAPGTIGNSEPLRLSQQHRVLVRSPLAELMFASHEVLVPAKAFAGEPGVCVRPCGNITFVHFLLEQHHILRANDAECESLFLGSETGEILQSDLAGVPHIASLRKTHLAARPILTYREAVSIIGTRLTRARQVSI